MFLLIAGILINLLAFSQQDVQNNAHWFRNGPFGARIRSLAIAPSNPNVIYIGTVSSGLYKTNNGGQTWNYCSTENLPEIEDTLFYSYYQPCWWEGSFYPINAIAVSPQNENHVWIGTQGRGLLESNDGGNSWQIANDSLPNSSEYNFININPENEDDILVGTEHYSGPPVDLKNGGLYRTLNGGASWQIVDSIPHGKSYFISSIERDPVNNNHILIGVGSSSEPGFAWGIMETFDNGNNWHILNDMGIFMSICINPSNNQNIWAVVYTGFQDYLLMNSNDGGHTWNLCEGFSNPYTWVTSLYADQDFNLYIKKYKEYPSYNLCILKSSDNGLTWNEVDKLNDYHEYYFGHTLTNSCQAVSSNTNSIYFGDFYGVYHSNDGGITTTELNTNLMNSNIKDLEINPLNHNIVYSSGDKGLLKTTDGGRNWERKVNTPVNFSKIDPIHPDTLYYSGTDFMRSFDGGTTFQSIRHNVAGNVTDLAIHPVSPNILFICTDYGYFYKSTDFGNTWSFIFENLNIEQYPKIVIDPMHPDTLYYGNHRSIDGGLAWQINALSVKIIGVHPQNSNILYGTSSNEADDIKVSNNWGSSFQVLDTHHSPVSAYTIRKFTIAKDNPDYLYYCTGNDGVHYSMDAGANWQKLEGSYDYRTTDVIPLLNKNMFYISTYGDGVWVYDTLFNVSVKENPVLDKEKLLVISPNPFSDFTKITYITKNAGLANISVYDMYGKRIITLLNENKNCGEYTLQWNGKSENGKEIKSGVYVVRLISDKRAYTQKVIFNK